MVTNRRLHIKRGIVSRTIQETRLERVQNVNYTQSVTQRMLQIGDVDFDTAAGDDYTFIFAASRTLPTSSTWSTSAGVALPDGLDRGLARAKQSAPPS